MFDTIFGLPTHALVVHAVVVFVPLAALGAIAVALVPSWDRRWGVAVVIAAFIGFGSAFVAKESGEDLASRVGTPLAHYDIARWMPWFALALFVFSTLLWLIDRGSRIVPGRGWETRSPLAVVLALLSIIAAILALIWVIRAGHSGAQAVWGTIIDNTKPGSQPVP